ncbi:alpha/beta fold hydrolase [Arthrobacter castelli]|uniref:alpha/beta fold hydrolase n=1 Tax=Arthrobacter castelli TaxID=271431 RepID=UPI0003FA103D|nr:alpha/beta hydrolase [Arthrobacter castelli]
MSTFVLIHGGGSTAWDWHLVAPLLERKGHRAVAVDLPIEDAEAGLEDYVQAMTDAVDNQVPGDGRKDVIVVGHSLGGFTAPLACEALHADGLVYLAGMIPWPGEAFMDWWTNTCHDREDVDSGSDAAFFNWVPGDLADEARSRERDQQGEWMSRPWPADRHPDVPTAAILCRDDQFFPPSFMRRQISERLGIEPVEVDGGHYASLSNPESVAEALDDVACTS